MVPDEAYIVANGGGGDRAVYIELPDGQLDLLPRLPNPWTGRQWTGWNFGYDGTGPAHLERAISRTFEFVDEIDRDQFPSNWVYQQVCHSDKTHLRISVRDIRARYNSSA